MILDGFLFVFLVIYSLIGGVFGESRVSAWVSGFMACGAYGLFVKYVVMIAGS